jgi:hypothetical protein
LFDGEYDVHTYPWPPAVRRKQFNICNGNVHLHLGDQLLYYDPVRDEHVETNSAKYWQCFDVAHGLFAGVVDDQIMVLQSDEVLASTTLVIHGDIPVCAYPSSEHVCFFGVNMMNVAAYLVPSLIPWLLP